MNDAIRLFTIWQSSRTTQAATYRSKLCQVLYYHHLSMKTKHWSPLHVSVTKINYIFSGVHDTILNTDDDSNDDDGEDDDDEQR